MRDVKNTLIKFAMDQTVGAAINIPLFLVTIGAVKGQGLEQILDTVRRVSFGRVLLVDLYSHEAARFGWGPLTAIIGCLVHLPRRHEVVAGRIPYQLCCRACRA